MKTDLRSRDICRMFKVTTQTLFNWRKEGMPFSGSGKMLLYDEKAVRDFLNNRDNSDTVKEIVKENYDKN